MIRRIVVPQDPAKIQAKGDWSVFASGSSTNDIRPVLTRLMTALRSAFTPADQNEGRQV